MLRQGLRVGPGALLSDAQMLGIVSNLYSRAGRHADAVADAVIGPVFIHHVASRTLAGIKRHVERG